MVVESQAQKGLRNKTHAVEREAENHPNTLPMADHTEHRATRRQQNKIRVLGSAYRYMHCNYGQPPPLDPSLIMKPQESPKTELMLARRDTGNT